MNHLAHALLSGGDEDHILGGMLGDFVHGHIPANLRPGVQAGLRLHRAIDVFTDAHAEIAALRALFEPPYRRFAGIIIDVWFDHLLARDFERWSNTPLTRFSERLNELLKRHDHELPEPLHRFAVYMRSHGLPRGYANRAVLARVFGGMSARFSRINPLASALEEATRLEQELSAGFQAFFPQLLHFAEQQRGQ